MLSLTLGTRGDFLCCVYIYRRFAYVDVVGKIVVMRSCTSAVGDVGAFYYWRMAKGVDGEWVDWGRDVYICNGHMHCKRGWMEGILINNIVKWCWIEYFKNWKRFFSILHMQLINASLLHATFNYTKAKRLWQPQHSIDTKQISTSSTSSTSNRFRVHMKYF